MSQRFQAVLWNRQKRIYDTTLALAVAVWIGLFAGTSFELHPEATAETVAIRALGATALVLLHTILCIGPLARLDRRFLPLLYNRRHLGVAMFLLAAGHGVFAIVQFHALGDRNPIVSVLSANPRIDSASQFPFELMGFAALLILAAMAASSHDFWLRTLTAPVWKALHMGVYVAYGLVLLHVAWGPAEEPSAGPLRAAILGGALIVAALHSAAAWRERIGDRAVPVEDAWVDACAVSDLRDGRGRIVTVGGERVAIFRYGELVSAVSNVCQHQNGPLGEGRIIDGCITCPWHGYQYEPGTGRAPAPFTDRVPTFDVAIRAGRVWIAETPHPPGTSVEPARIPPDQRE